jgi:hypothetical protein
VLVYFNEDETTLIYHVKEIVSGFLRKGGMCEVMYGNNLYTVKIISKGTV